MAYRNDPLLVTLFHDVKNCLNNIAIATALLEEDEIASEDKQKYTTEIRKNYTQIKTMLVNFMED
ncbi:hypothetical protein LWM68_16385 [Niabella sp. W65]|jgi:nitrogen-specific signal transduction histidine kinase|nr:hypothetical protein [Niabella sp. W65]MCH7364195.1 hypothetical protein [Niabella sp. W65]ULT40067.1 hypothetical protein KRR40_35220 [Niabella sp. I65]